MATKDKGRKAIAVKANALSELSIEYVPIGDVKPNDYNPNRQSDTEFELLMRSMREDGFTQPIIVQAETMTIVDGEHRWRASRELGFDEVPVVKVSMTEEQRRIATLRHNRARGSEDIQLSAAVLRDLEDLGALDWAQHSLMLDDVELKKLLEDIPAPEALATEDYAEAWEPESARAQDENVTSDGALGEASMTAAASDRLRERERKLAEAKDEEERAAIRRDTKVYRVILTFSDEEADLVKAVLEPTPAPNLLALCRDNQPEA